jgi:hypothetical protein
MNTERASRRHQQFDAEATYEDARGSKWNVGVEFKTIGGRVGIASLTVWPENAGEVISRRLLTDLPLNSLFKNAMAQESELLEAISRPRRVSTAHQGREHSEVELRQVAEVYQIAYKAHLPVQKSVATAFGISVSTAAKRIMAARQRGFIASVEGEKD